MKKIIILLMVPFIVAGMFSSCSTISDEDARIDIVCLSFPEYDWVRQILGDEVERFNLTLLVDSGVDIHSYQATAKDMIKISTCDLLIFTGGTSAQWVEDALQNSQNEQMRILRLLDFVDDSCHHEGEHVHEEDEHVWLSVQNAILFCQQITHIMKDLDEERADVYEKNANGYVEKLNILDSRYRAAAASTSKPLVFADRFPFCYLMGDYGFSYVAAFSGCSAESEASASVVLQLARAIDENDISSVLVLKNSNVNIARTVIESTAKKDQKILTVDSMQSINKSDIKSDITYLDIMEKNLNAIIEATK